MDDVLEKIIKERELVEHLRKVGIDGYSIHVIKGGYLYKFLDKNGQWFEFVNLSENGQKKLRIND